MKFTKSHLVHGLRGIPALTNYNATMDSEYPHDVVIRFTNEDVDLARIFLIRRVIHLYEADGLLFSNINMEHDDAAANLFMEKQGSNLLALTTREDIDQNGAVAKFECEYDDTHDNWRVTVHFRDPNHAMIFKLTYG